MIAISFTQLCVSVSVIWVLYRLVEMRSEIGEAGGPPIVGVVDFTTRIVVGDGRLDWCDSTPIDLRDHPADIGFIVMFAGPSAARSIDLDSSTIGRGNPDDDEQPVAVRWRHGGLLYLVPTESRSSPRGSQHQAALLSSDFSQSIPDADDRHGQEGGSADETKPGRILAQRNQSEETNEGEHSAREHAVAAAAENHSIAVELQHRIKGSLRPNTRTGT